MTLHPELHVSASHLSLVAFLLMKCFCTFCISPRWRDAAPFLSWLLAPADISLLVFWTCLGVVPEQEPPLPSSGVFAIGSGRHAVLSKLCSSTGCETKCERHQNTSCALLVHAWRLAALQGLQSCILFHTDNPDKTIPQVK